MYRYPAGTSHRKNLWAHPTNLFVCRKNLSKTFNFSWNTKESENAQPYQHLRPSNMYYFYGNKSGNAEPQKRDGQQMMHCFPAETCRSGSHGGWGGHAYPGWGGLWWGGTHPVRISLKEYISAYKVGKQTKGLVQAQLFHASNVFSCFIPIPPIPEKGMVMFSFPLLNGRTLFFSCVQLFFAAKRSFLFHLPRLFFSSMRTRQHSLCSHFIHFAQK